MVDLVGIHFIKTILIRESKSENQENGTPDMSDLCFIDKIHVTGKKLISWTLKSIIMIQFYRENQ